MRFVIAALCGAVVIGIPYRGVASELIEISNVWTVAADHRNAEVPLYMTITNHAGEEDALVRGRCGVAMFFEKHVVDHGEGAPAMRAVASLPIAAAGDTSLHPDGPHAMLLQTTAPLKEGETFDCTLSFRKAGAVAVQVSVKPADAAAGK